MEIQKFEYLENEKSILDEIKNIFRTIWRAIIWLKIKNWWKIAQTQALSKVLICRNPLYCIGFRSKHIGVSYAQKDLNQFQRSCSNIAVNSVTHPLNISSISLETCQIFLRLNVIISNHYFFTNIQFHINHTPQYYGM